MWVTDGSSELSVDRNRVECNVKSDSGDVYNAIWKGSDDTGITEGKTYWKLYCEGQCSLFAGVTDPAKFKKGWGCKGLFYGGNLSNGGSLLVSSFGPSLKGGDVLGLFLDMEGSTLKLYVDVNDRPLGLAFDVPKSTLGPVFPVVHFSGPGVVTIKQSTTFPSTTREEEKFEGFLGHWEYSTGSFDNSCLNGEAIILTIREEDENRYEGSLRVVNLIKMTIARDTSDAKWKGKNWGSTKMAGPPARMELERRLCSHIEGTFGLNSEGQLTISGMETSVWTRFVPKKDAVNENPFK